MAIGLSQKRALIKEHALSTGFHVEEGLKYGLDFLLYTEDPRRVHSRYGILIWESHLSHRRLVMCQRLCASVKKELILADVDRRGRVVLMGCERFVLDA